QTRLNLGERKDIIGFGKGNILTSRQTVTANRGSVASLPTSTAALIGLARC
ncbi:hypothetical protein DNTS_032763, partial [Danionella cerebrum]